LVLFDVEDVKFVKFDVHRHALAQLLQSYVYCELASFHPEIVERDKDLSVPFSLTTLKQCDCALL